MNQQPTFDQAAVIGPISSANTTALVAAPGAGKRIRVHGFRLSAAGAQSATVGNGASAMEVFNLVAGEQVILPLRGQPYYVLAENTALNLVTTTTAVTNGRVEYSVA